MSSNGFILDFKREKERHLRAAWCRGVYGSFTSAQRSLLQAVTGSYLAKDRRLSKCDHNVPNKVNRYLALEL